MDELEDTFVPLLALDWDLDGSTVDGAEQRPAARNEQQSPRKRELKEAHTSGRISVHSFSVGATHQDGARQWLSFRAYDRHSMKTSTFGISQTSYIPIATALSEIQPTAVGRLIPTYRPVPPRIQRDRRARCRDNNCLRTERERISVDRRDLLHSESATHEPSR